MTKLLVITLTALLLCFACNNDLVNDTAPQQTIKQENTSENSNTDIKTSPQNPTTPSQPSQEQNDTPIETPSEQPKEEQKDEPAQVTVDEYEIREIHKGADKQYQHYNIVFLGINFDRSKNQWESDKDDYLPERSFFNHVERTKATMFGEKLNNESFSGIEPFKSYKDYIDIYAIVVESKTTDYTQTRFTGFTNEGEARVKILLDALYKEHSVKHNLLHTLIQMGETAYGRAFLVEKSFSSTKDVNDTIHEMCHAIGGLGDEKTNPGIDANNVPNLSYTQAAVPWKDIINFNNITTVQEGNIWKPTNHNCMMGLNTGYGSLCEVCRYAVAVKMSSVIKSKNIEMYNISQFEDTLNYDTYSQLKDYIKNKNTNTSISFVGNQTIFAKGVDVNTTKYDANKNGNNDSQLCWAATSANVIAWWQDNYPGTLDSNLTRNSQDIFEKFKNIWTNKEGTYVTGILWYISGGESGPTGTGEYLLKYLKTSDWNLYNPKAYKRVDPVTNLTMFSENVADGLQNGVIALGIADRNYNSRYGSAGHAVTIFGADFKDTIVTAVYIADSDDNFLGLKKYNVSQENDYVRINYSGLDRIKNMMIVYQPRL